MSVVDLVADARGLTVAYAALWLGQNFKVQRKQPRTHLAGAGARPPYHVGMEQPIDLLVRFGLWARLSVPAQCIVPVLLSFAEPAGLDAFQVEISYRGMMRYSGLRSFSAVSGALNQLAEIGWLRRAGNAARGQIIRDTGTYVLTPFSEAVKERANTISLEEREIIQAERELRDEQRRHRRAVMAERTRRTGDLGNPDSQTKETSSPHGFTQYDSLYSRSSVGENHATPTLSPEATEHAAGSVIQRFDGLRMEPSGVGDPGE